MNAPKDPETTDSASHREKLMQELAATEMGRDVAASLVEAERLWVLAACDVAIEADLAYVESGDVCIDRTFYETVKRLLSQRSQSWEDRLVAQEAAGTISEAERQWLMGASREAE